MATQTSNYNINIERIKLDPIEGFKELSNTFHKNETYGLTELTTRFTIKEGADNDELLMEVFDKQEQQILVVISIIKKSVEEELQLQERV